MEGTDADVVAICASLGEPNVLLSLVDDVLRDQGKFDEVLARSYVHNNGFHKIVLHQSGQGHKLRLHVFDVESLCVEEGVHNHRWSFASTVILGTLRQDVLADADECAQAEDGVEVEEVHQEYVYDTDGTRPGQVCTRSIGRKVLRVIDSPTYSAGTTYFMDTDTLHRIIDRSSAGGAGLTATLVITNPPSRKTCRLFNNTPIPTPRTYAPQELRSVLAQVRDRLVRTSTITHESEVMRVSTRENS